MATMKSFLILSLISFVVTVSASRGRQQQQQRGRAAAIAAAAEPHHDAIEKALDKAEEHKDALKDPEDLSHKAIAVESEKLQKHLTVALATAITHPGAIDNHPALAKEKEMGHHEALEHHLKEAEKHHEILKNEGKTLSPEKAVEHHEALQHHLGLAQHHAVQHNIAAHEVKAVVAAVKAA